MTEPTVVRKYDRVLMTGITIGLRRYDFILPYAGNLTHAQLDKSAAKLREGLCKLGITISDDWAKERLQNEWYTGRNKDVRVEEYDAYISVYGQGFGMTGHPKDAVIVL